MPPLFVWLQNVTFWVQFSALICSEFNGVLFPKLIISFY